MRTTTARGGLLGGALLAALALSGCATSPEDIEIGDGIAPTVDGADGGAQALPEEGSADPGASEPATVSGGESPAPGTCVQVAAAGDGVYPVADAGIVTITFTEGALALAVVEPFAGWAYEVTGDEPSKVEVELRKNGEELDLEVEVDDGDVMAEVCADDD